MLPSANNEEPGVLLQFQMHREIRGDDQNKSWSPIHRNHAKSVHPSSPESVGSSKNSPRIPPTTTRGLIYFTLSVYYVQVHPRCCVRFIFVCHSSSCAGGVRAGEMASFPQHDSSSNPNYDDAQLLLKVTNSNSYCPFDWCLMNNLEETVNHDVYQRP